MLIAHLQLIYGLFGLHQLRLPFIEKSFWFLLHYVIDASNILRLSLKIILLKAIAAASTRIVAYLTFSTSCISIQCRANVVFSIFSIGRDVGLPRLPVLFVLLDLCLTFLCSSDSSAPQLWSSSKILSKLETHKTNVSLRPNSSRIYTGARYTTERVILNPLTFSELTCLLPLGWYGATSTHFTKTMVAD